MSRANVDLVRATYDALARRDLEAAQAAFDVDAEWGQPEVLPWGGLYRGPEGLARFFSKLGEHVEGGRVEIDEALDAGDHVVVLGHFHARARRSGREFRVRLSHVWKLTSGRVVWFYNYVDTAALLRALDA